MLLILEVTLIIGSVLFGDNCASPCGPYHRFINSNFDIREIFVEDNSFCILHCVWSPHPILLVALPVFVLTSGIYSVSVLIDELRNGKNR